MFEKPLITPAQKESYQKAELDAIRKGEVWPTKEGLNYPEVATAFDDFFANASWSDLYKFNDDLSRVTLTDRNDSKARMMKISQNAETAKNLTNWAAIFTFISVGLLEALGAKVVFDLAIAKAEAYALKAPAAQAEQYQTIVKHLQKLRDLEAKGWKDRQEAASVAKYKAS